MKGAWLTSIGQFSLWVAVYVSLSKQLHNAINFLGLSREVKTGKKCSVAMSVVV